MDVRTTPAESPLRLARRHRNWTLDRVVSEIDAYLGGSGVTASLVSAWERGTDGPALGTGLPCAPSMVSRRRCCSPIRTRVDQPSPWWTPTKASSTRRTSSVDSSSSKRRWLGSLAPRRQLWRSSAPGRGIVPLWRPLRRSSGCGRGSSTGACWSVRHTARCSRTTSFAYLSCVIRPIAATGCRPCTSAWWEDQIREPERFFVASESQAVVTIPRLTAASNFDSGILLAHPLQARALVEHAKQLYAGSTKLETPLTVEVLPVLR